jgi:hypothetical protein
MVRGARLVTSGPAPRFDIRDIRANHQDFCAIRSVADARRAYRASSKD